MATKTLYLISTATASPFPTTSKTLSETNNASEVELIPGEFDSGFPGNTDAGQWNPSSALGITVSSAEIDNTGASLGTTRQGWLWDQDLTGKTLAADVAWSFQLRLREVQTSPAVAGRICARVTIVTGSAGAWTTVKNLFTTSITGETSHSTGQAGWRAQNEARITVATTRTNYSVTVGGAGTVLGHSFSSGERILVELGFCDGDSTVDRTWALYYNLVDSFVTTPDIVTAYTLAAAQGSFSLTGQATNLLSGRKVTAAQGSYAVNGQTVALAHGYKVTASQGSFSLGGQAVTLTSQRKLTATQGSYALNGQSGNLLAGHRLAAAQGAYSLGGQAVNLLAGHLLAAAQGSYAVNGQAVALIFTPGAGAFTLVAAQGGFALSGQPVALLAAHLLAAAQGGYALNGQPITLAAARVLLADLGSFALAGQALALLFGSASAPVTDTTLPVIMAAMAATLEALPPGFRRAPRRVPLRQQLANSSLLRRFEILRAGPARPVGPHHYYVQRRVRLEVAYPAAAVGLYGLEDLDDLADVMDADARLIYDALSSPANVANAAHKASFVTILKADRTAAAWYQGFLVDVRYWTPINS